MIESRFSRLADLAKERSSDKRRELLREVTDLFFDRTGQRSLAEEKLFDDILVQVAAEMEQEVLAELAAKLAPHADAPKRLTRKMAGAAIEIAEPLLRQSAALDEATLVDVARHQSQAHLVAISQRSALSSQVSDLIVERGTDETIEVLLNNQQAQLSRAAFEKVTDRMADGSKLHASFVNRKDVPLDLLNEVFIVVERNLRDRILERNQAASSAEVEAAMSVARSRIAQNHGALPADYSQAEVYISQRKAQRTLNGPLLVTLLREKKMTHFLVALAELSGVDFGTVQMFWTRQDLDGLATICRASSIDRAVFVTLAMLNSASPNGMAQVERFGRLYQDVPQEAAQRAVRFWKVRRLSRDVPSAA